MVYRIFSRRTASRGAVDKVGEHPVTALRFASGVAGWLMPLVPLKASRAVIGCIAATVAGRPTGWSERVRHNLELVYENRTEAELEAIITGVPKSIGYSFAELFSGKRFVDLVRNEPLVGAGAHELMRLHAENKSAFLVTGHIGNYDAIRGALVARGYRLGGLYRPMNDKAFNASYVRAISRLGPLLFPKGKVGLAHMMRHLKQGGMVGVVNDQFAQNGVNVSFLGRPAKTALSIAEIAIRNSIPFFPCYGIRRADGGFDLIIEAPIVASNALEMMEAFHKSLERMIEQYPEQWLWSHRRWKA